VDFTKMKKQDLIKEIDSLQATISKLEEDIAQLKKIEETLYRREEELAATFDNSPTPMFAMDDKRRIWKINRAAERYTYKSSRECIGLCCGQALACNLSKRGCGLNSACKSCQLLRTVIKTYEDKNRCYQKEISLDLSRGNKNEIVHLLIATSPFTIRGKRIVLVSFQDITERVKTEQELRRIVSNARRLLPEAKLNNGP